MERISEKMCQIAVSSFSHAMGRATCTGYNDIGSYHTDSAYGGQTLVRVMSSGGGVDDRICGSGFRSKRAFYDEVHAGLDAIREYKRSAGFRADATRFIMESMTQCERIGLAESTIQAALDVGDLARIAFDVNAWHVRAIVNGGNLDKQLELAGEVTIGRSGEYRRLTIEMEPGKYPEWMIARYYAPQEFLPSFKASNPEMKPENAIVREFKIMIRNSYYTPALEP